jgi:hypothetical protein
MTQFKTAREFARYWQGNKKIPDLTEGAEKRQDKMIGLMLNAATATAVINALYWNNTVKALSDLIRVRNGVLVDADGNSSGLTLEKLEADVNACLDKPARESRKALYELVMNQLSAPGLLKTHREWAKNSEWDDYVHARNNYHLIKNYFDKQEALGHPTGVERPERPEDPRIRNYNDRLGQWLFIKDSGPKTASSIASKIERKKKLAGLGGEGMQSPRGADEGNVGQHIPAYDIRDINRIMILPDVPETADDFYEVLSEQIQKKVAHLQDGVPHLFKEKWSVKPWGQFDRMAYIALHAEHADGSLKQDDVAIAEIKVVGKQMEKADSLTAPLYALHRELDNVDRFFPKGNASKRTDPMKEREAFRMLHNQCAAAFKAVCKKIYEKQTPPYTFPPLPKELNRPIDFENLRQQLNSLSQEIYIDALNGERSINDWAPVFLATAYYQEAAAEAKSGGLKPKKEISNTGVNAVRIEERILRKVGGEGVFDHDKIRRHALEQWRKDQGKEHLNANGASGRRKPAPMGGIGQ